MDFEAKKPNTQEADYITIVGGWHNIFKLFPIKYVDCHEVTLGMSMLTSL